MAPPGTALDRDLNSLERIELSAKLSAAAIALTYITGYLTASTYPAGYGIQTDASDFFRAKYMYVGFHYWLFTSSLLVSLIFLWWLYKWVMHSRAGDRKRPIIVIPEEKKEAEKNPFLVHQPGDEIRALR